MLKQENLAETLKQWLEDNVCSSSSSSPIPGAAMQVVSAAVMGLAAQRMAQRESA
jgi:hypothetical protein